MSINNPYDHALKLLASAYPEQFLQLGFPNQSIQLLGTLSNVELALEIDRVDFLHEMELEGEQVYCHIDFQLEHSASCPRRFFVYNSMLTEMKKPIPVITLPVYLRPRQKEIPKHYEVKVGETVFHRFTYPIIKLWEYVDLIRKGDLYIFAPLLPLLTESMSEESLIEERQLILSYESDPNRQNTLLTTAILIASQAKLFESDFLWDLFKEDQMDMDNPVIARLFEREYNRKLAEETKRFTAAIHHAEAEAVRREAEAEAEATRTWQELMFKLLGHRFKAIPVDFFMLLQSVPPTQRSQISDIIFDAPDVEQCLQALKQLRMEKP